MSIQALCDWLKSPIQPQKSILVKQNVFLCQNNFLKKDNTMAEANSNDPREVELIGLYKTRDNEIKRGNQLATAMLDQRIENLLGQLDGEKIKPSHKTKEKNENQKENSEQYMGELEGKNLDGMSEYLISLGEHPAGPLLNANRFLVEGAKVRKAYVDEVSKLKPFDYDRRSYLKLKYRKPTPNEFLGPIKEYREGTGRRKGSVGRAHVTNPTVNKLASAGGHLGRGLGVLGVGLAAKDIYEAENRRRAALANAFSTGGAIVGGLGGAAIGGPIAIGTGIAGSLAGGHYGYDLGEYLHDTLYE